MSSGQRTKTSIADGRNYEPARAALQPTVEGLSADERAAVEKEARRIEVEFAVEPQTPSEELEFRKDFELLDVAKGFFISREIESKAFLYRGWSAKMNRNYQGIMIVSRSKNGGEWRSKVLAHYVYREQGDKFIRKMSDINRDFLDELAVFSDFSTKKMTRRTVRLLEFSPRGLEKIGLFEIYSHINQKQPTPIGTVGSKPPDRIYIPPVVTASKILVQGKLSGPPVFSRQDFKQKGDEWTATDSLTNLAPPADPTVYVELVNVSKGRR